MRRALVAAALAAIAWGALACQDSLNAPGVCPEFCPGSEVVVHDTVLYDAVAGIGSFSGYRLANEAAQLQVVGPAGPAESRALIKFFRFSTTYSGSDTTVNTTILETDSFRITLPILRRTAGVPGVVLALHRIPYTFDSTTTYDELTPYFQDSTLLGTVSVPDTLTVDSLEPDSVSLTVPTAAFSSLELDSLRLAVGVRIVSGDPVFVSLASADSLPGVNIRRFVQDSLKAGGGTATAVDGRLTLFDTFVVDPAGLGTPMGLAIGGLPATRSFVNVAVPASILDSTQIVRATLLLVPTRPALAAPGDTMRVRAHALGADFGPKSPFIAAATDTTSAGSALVAAGTADTVAIEVTDLLRFWNAHPTLPHTILLRLTPEGAAISQLDVGGGGSLGPAPVLHITYAPPYRIFSP